MLWQVMKDDATYWIEASSNDEALASMIGELDPFQSMFGEGCIRYFRVG